ncbi:TRAP transporter large permease subunit [Psychrosphaera aquimarina]|uniref:TRAP transporter large permease protein n=1 Tax=Psychrosphaera aquimarina TaxID=2044854 RepID=A0ABU3R2U2_9GAMM|nr:TRAP transporter large permease subunit [Psychrosphaera aquimarina]MDU0113994.1 TRAP transporter large permease subunit [Psychrosphaera aquimarina]
MEWISLLMFLVVCLVLMLGYPVAFTLAGTALIFSVFGLLTNIFDHALLNALPSRLYGIMTNQTLLAVPLFVFMGVMLERSKVAEELLSSMTNALGRLPAGMGIAVTLVGALMAASTGIVGATVVTMGLMSLPSMMKAGYNQSYATGVIAATGTLGQIIPPSIALVLLGDVLSSSYQQAQLSQGIFSPETISVGDLFAGALIPGLILVVMYLLYSIYVGVFKAQWAPKPTQIEQVSLGDLLSSLIPPLVLILVVLGSILLGVATPTEAAGLGAFGAMIIALFKNKLDLPTLKSVMLSTTTVTSMVFMILIGASIFSLVFRGFGGEELIHSLFENMPGGKIGALITVMVVIFLLGFILDFIEITFVVVPLVAPVLFVMGVDPIWLGIMIAINLQTSFLTPPFGFALFYLRGVTPSSIPTSAIYKGVIPFIVMQLLLLVGLAIWPEIATTLPNMIYG